jgi:acyl dehydratase
MISSRSLDKSPDYFPVALGYDHVRFLKPVFIGDTVTVRYTVEELDQERKRSLAKIEVFNQSCELVMVAQHIMKWVPRSQRTEEEGNGENS